MRIQVKTEGVSSHCAVQCVVCVECVGGQSGDLPVTMNGKKASVAGGQQSMLRER